MSQEGDRLSPKWDTAASSRSFCPLPATLWPTRDTRHCGEEVTVLHGRNHVFVIIQLRKNVVVCLRCLGARLLQAPLAAHSGTLERVRLRVSKGQCGQGVTPAAQVALTQGASMNTTVDYTAATLAKISANDTALAWFKPYLKKWPRNFAGEAPTNAMLMVALLLGKRPGVEAGHLAMTLRPEGCTVQQFCTAFSCGPANNYRRAMVKSGWFACTVQGKPYAFKLTITAKGAARIERAVNEAAALATAGTVDATAKPAKGKARKAAKKGKGKPAAVPVTEQPAPQAPTNEPAPVTGEPAGEVQPVTAEALNNLASHFNG